MNHYDC